MPKTHFTDSTIANLPTGEWYDQRYPNLYMRVGKRTRTWMFRRKRLLDGSRPGGNLGRWPDLNKEAAVLKYEDERGRLARGEPHPDPAERIRELERELLALKRATGQFVSFEDLTERFLDKYTSNLAESTTELYRSLLINHAIPVWRGRDAEALEPFEIEEHLHQLKAEKRATACMLHQVLTTMYRWGVKKELIKTNPLSRVEIPGKRAKRERVLTPTELKAAWESFSKIESCFGDALKLLLMTWQRRFEVGGLEWTEVLDDDWWLLPKERTKTKRRSNLIYLPPLSVRLIQRQADRATGSKYVFRGYRRKEKPVSLSRISAECRNVSQELMRQGVSNSRFTVHDLRRTATTRAREAGVDKSVTRTILNHESNTVTDIYDLYEMKPEIQSAMQTWNDYLVDLLGIRPSDV